MGVSNDFDMFDYQKVKTWHIVTSLSFLSIAMPKKIVCLSIAARGHATFWTMYADSVRALT